MPLVFLISRTIRSYSTVIKCFGRLQLRKQRRPDKPIRELIFILNIPEYESVFDEIWRKKEHDAGLFLNIVKCFNPAHLSGRWKTRQVETKVDS